ESRQLLDQIERKIFEIEWVQKSKMKAEGIEGVSDIVDSLVSWLVMHDCRSADGSHPCVERPGFLAVDIVEMQIGEPNATGVSGLIGNERASIDVCRCTVDA